MSAHSSDSEDGLHKAIPGWTYVTSQGDVESDKESSSSMEFVNLDEDVVSFHRDKSASVEKDHCHSASSDQRNERDKRGQSDLCDETSKTTTSASDDHTIITETPLTRKNSSSVLSTGCDAPPQETVKHDAANIEMPMPAAGAGDEHQDDAEALINLNRDGERSSCSEDARSSSDAESFDMMDNCSSQSSDGMEKVEDAELLTVSDQDEERETVQGSDHGDDSGLYDTSLQEAAVSMMEGTSSSTEQGENGIPPEVFVTTSEEKDEQNVLNRTEMEESSESNDSFAVSGIYDASMLYCGNSDYLENEYDDNLEYESETEMEELRYDEESHEKMSVLSGSDGSDFVKLDVQADVALCEPDLEASTSSHSNASSISANFSFLRPYPRLVHIDTDEESTPGDVDDRTESDQSVGGRDDDDSDLSSLAYGLGDTPLDDGRQVIIYRHHPNQNLNSMLTWLAVTSLMLALGVGIGHFLGSVKEGSLRLQQVMKLREMQDEYLMCMRQQDFIDTVHTKLTQNIKELEGEVLSWKQKYQEMENNSSEGDPSLQGLIKLQKKITEVTHLNEEMETLKTEHHTSSIISQKGEPEKELRNTINKLEDNIFLMQQDKEVLNKDYKSLKDRVNELLVENKDLKEEVGKLRYLKHPANTDQQEITTASIDTVNALTSENPNRKDERAKLSDSENQLNEDNDDISATEMKNQVNMLNNENQDLKSMIGKLRYGQVVITNQEDTKQNAINTAEQKQDHGGIKLMSQVKERLNELANENEDLKQSVMKLRYGLPALQVSDREEDSLKGENLHSDELLYLKARLNDIKKQLQMEKVHSQMWQTMYVNEQTRKQEQHHANKEPQVPSFLTCMSILAPTFNWTDFVRLSGDNYIQITKDTLNHQWEFFRNISMDNEYADTLAKKWSEFLNYAKSRDFTDYTVKAKGVYEDIQKTIWNKWAVFQQEYYRPQTFQHHADSVKDSISEFAKSVHTKISDVKNRVDGSDFVKSYFEKSRETVVRVGKKIHNTFGHLKDMSSDFLKEQKPTLDKLKKKVVDKFSKIGDKISSKIERVKNNLKKKHDGWIRKQKKKKNRDVKFRKNKENKKKENAKRHRKVKEMSEGNKYSKYEFDFNHKNVHHHRNKNFKKHQAKKDFPRYQQQKHRRHSRRTEDDMESPSQDKIKYILSADEILDETIFGSGGYRHQKKTRKRFQKLYDRVQGYDEQVIQDMDDDDDIDDLYDDLEDFQHDIQDEDYQGGLLTWLTCQLRWWKSRLHRKNRNEDILDGCGRHMMQFQIHTICGPPCDKQGNCGHLTSPKSPLCEDSFLFIHQNYRKSFKNCHKKKCQKKFKKEKRHKRSKKAKKIYEMSETTSIDKKNKDDIYTAEGVENLRIEDNESQNNESYFYRYEDDTPAADWFSRWMEDREDGRHSSRWYFDRMEDREDHHHDSLWYVKAVEENRKMEENPDWFLNRMKKSSAEDGDSGWIFEYDPDNSAP